MRQRVRSRRCREKMAVASTLAGTAFVNGGLGAVHGISQAMGGVAHVAHGTANSMMLPYVIEKNIPGNLEKFGKIAKLLGENVAGLSKWEAAHCAISAVQKLAADQDSKQIDGGWRDERNVPGDYQGNDGIPPSCGQSGEDYGAGCRGNIGKSI